MGYGKDFLTGVFGLVERHHIFGGALRTKSERYGLVVELSPWNHREGPDAAHRCKETADKLKRYGQRKAMLEQGWDVDTFIREFGKNYLDERELAEIYDMQKNGLRYESDGSDYEEYDWTREEPEGNVHDSVKDARYLPVTVRAQPGVGFRVTLEVMPF